MVIHFPAQLIVPLLALGASFFAATNNVLIRKGLDHGTRAEALFISLCTSILVYWLVLVAVDLAKEVWNVSALWFVGAGVLAPGAARILNVISLERIGVARTMPIAGIAPLFAVLLAVAFLDELFSFAILIGIFFIVFGIYVLSREKKENGKRFEKKDILYPLGSALCGGFSLLLSKQGLLSMDPFVGAAITATVALMVVSAYIVISKEAKREYPSKRLFFFAMLAGVCMVGGFTLNFTALEMGNVSVSAPLFGTFPLFATFLSHFLLKEHITGRIWLAAVLMVCGVIVITFV